MSDTTGNTTAFCDYCGKPLLSGVWIGSRMYHIECTRSPNYYTPPPLSEEDIRRIVREELDKRASTLLLKGASALPWKDVQTWEIYPDGSVKRLD